MKKAKTKKSVYCSGLAFLDEEDMEMLHSYALEGWILKEVKGIRYILYKEEPQDLIFSYDMNKVKKEDRDDYLSIFEEAGWTNIPFKDSTCWFFCAKNGTPSIHSDQMTRAEMYTTTNRIAWISFFISFIVFIGCLQIDSSSIFILIIFMLSAGIAAGSLVLGIGTMFRLRGKRIRTPMPTFTQSIIGCIVGAALLLFSIYFLEASTLKHILFMIAGGILGGSSVMLIMAYPLHRDRKEKFVCITKKEREINND